MLNVQDQICDKRELQAWRYVQDKVRTLIQIQTMVLVRGRVRNQVDNRVVGHTWDQVWEEMRER